MAFNQENSGASVSNKGNFEKAIGFINFSLPTDGGQAKLGAIPLKLSVESEKWLCEFLAADPANVEKVKQNLIITFNAVKPGAAGFKLV